MKLHVKPGSNLVFMKAGSMPNGGASGIDHKLWLSMGFWNKWMATPVVPLPKKDGGIQVWRFQGNTSAFLFFEVANKHLARTATLKFKTWKWTSGC